MRRAPVKCGGNRQLTRGNKIRRGLGISAALALELMTGPINGQPRPPLLLGGEAAPPKSPVELDPLLPTGAAISAEPGRPPQSASRIACSLNQTVCVHAPKDGPRDQESGVLDALERAYFEGVRVLGLPAPLPDWNLGGTDGLDLYLEDSVTGLRTGLDALRPGRDRASLYCLLGQSAAEEIERSVTQCVGEAIAAGLNAAASPHLRRAVADELWLNVGSPTNQDYAELQTFQLHPERALFARDRSLTEEGEALFLSWFAARRARASGPTVAAGFLALSASETPASALEWKAEPDLLDMLRHNLEGTAQSEGAKLAHLMGDFSVARAFVGPRDDGSHFPEFGWIGDAGRIRFDWSLKYSQLPKRVACTPVDPSGAVYLWLDLDDLPLGATLGFQAEWEGPGSFQWVLVKVDAQGQEQQRLEVPFQERVQSAEHRLVELEQSRGILLVGTHLGGIDASHPYDPDHAPYEPHGCTVYLVAL